MMMKMMPASPIMGRRECEGGREKQGGTMDFMSHKQFIHRKVTFYILI